MQFVPLLCSTVPVYPDEPVLRGIGLLEVSEFEAAVARQRAARAVVARRTAAAVVPDNHNIMFYFWVAVKTTVPRYGFILTICRSVKSS